VPAPLFLTIGHVTTDVIDGRDVSGGAALYSAAQAAALGWRVGVFTSAPRGHAATELLHARGAEVASLESEHPTTFVYAQVRGARRSALTHVAKTLEAASLPRALAACDVALLGPVFHEIPLDFLEHARLAARVVGVAPQGFLRKRGEGNVVERAPQPLPSALIGRATAVFLSEHDVDDSDSVARGYVAQGARLVVVTRGERGATLFRGESRSDVAAAPAHELDPTGAGDVFATSFLIATHEGATPAEAARFAAAAAACSVEGESVSAVAGRDAISKRSFS